MFCGAVDRWRVAQGVRGGADGARAARVALSPESRAPRNACIIIMTDADRASAPLICGAFDLAARAGPAAPAAQTSRLLTFIRFDAALPVVRPFALALNRGFYLVNSGSATVSAGRAWGQWSAWLAQYGVCARPLPALSCYHAMKQRQRGAACRHYTWITWTLCVRIYSLYFSVFCSVAC